MTPTSIYPGAFGLVQIELEVPNAVAAVRANFWYMLDGSVCRAGSPDVDVFLTVSAIDGIRDLQVKTRQPMVTKPITTTFLRRLPLAEMERHVRAKMNESAKWTNAHERSRLFDRVQNSSTLRVGRVGRPDIEYAHTAQQYVRLTGLSARPVADLAAEMGLDAGQVRGLLGEARRRGLLTASPTASNGDKRGGRAGGQLTEKAIKLLS
jgi:hypothetical protein